MKNYLQAQYLEFERSSQRPINEVRDIIQETWGSKTSSQLLLLIESMPWRFQAYIEINEGTISN